MRFCLLLRAVLAIGVLCCLAWARAAQADDSDLCRSAIARVERERGIPDAFLSAIARVETGRPDRVTGGLAPWPWTINAEGTGSFFTTKAEAVAAVRALQARGVKSIDVGCLQVNLMHHPEAFASLEQGFDPQENAEFAGHLLISLFQQTGSWPRAAAAYHSQTPPIGAAYQKRVLAEWAVPDGEAAAKGPAGGTSPERRRASPAQPPPQATPPAPQPSRSMGKTLFAMGDPAPRVIGLSRPAPGAIGIPTTGRGLDAYRMMPTLLAFNMPPRPRQ